MVSFTPAATLVLSLLGAVTALPTESVEVLEVRAENPTVQARAIGDIYLCTDINYKGTLRLQG